MAREERGTARMGQNAVGAFACGGWAGVGAGGKQAAGLRAWGETRSGVTHAGGFGAGLPRWRAVSGAARRSRRVALRCCTEQVQQEADRLSDGSDSASALGEDRSLGSLNSIVIPSQVRVNIASPQPNRPEESVRDDALRADRSLEESPSRHLSRLSSLDAFLDDGLSRVAERQKEDPRTKRTDVIRELQEFFFHADTLTAANVAALVGAFALILSLCVQSSPLPVEPLMDLLPPATEQGVFERFMQHLQSPNSVVPIALGLSAFTQSLTGFGFAIVSVGILTQFPWISNSNLLQDVQPIAAICGLFVSSVNLIPSWREVKWKDCAPVILASVCATPFGAEMLNCVDVGVALKTLGAVILGFVVYLSSGLKAPKWFASKSGSVFWGSLAGLFGGAFDIQGPPLVFWTQGTDFRANEVRASILAVCAINSVAVIAHDLSQGRMDDFYVMEFVKSSLPVVCLGIIAGRWVTTRLDPDNFRKVVLFSCLVMGARLLAS
ncbi:hypothetical protein FVE85_2248 [Porphyridium purpureum]|uniref:Membrane transporter protein n=1 Tax=Porphyridium purpureum TaxID=35688 RepID=A0A5J4YZU2_PORPP|nr:hypothetical protein FVE85_2248 [Porphyridium purpureum]|eukprot:POR5833..scf209_3